MRSLRFLASQKEIKEIVIVSQEKYFPLLKRHTRALSRPGITFVKGGPFRGDSVKRGFQAISPSNKIVLIHDSARPLVKKETIQAVIKATWKTGAALAAWPLPDTLKKSRGVYVRHTIPRKDLWLAQTPQGLRYDVARHCLPHPSPHATDDVELAERKGFPVQIVRGTSTNFKVTYPEDYILCQKLL